MTRLHSEIHAVFAAARRVLIVSHVRPDGDAIGSLLALGLALQDAGKQVELVLSDGLPGSHRHLPGSEKVTDHASGDFDLVVVVDCSDLKRTGDALGGRTPDLVIDHHATSTAFGKLNCVEADAAATASILARHLPAWGLKITPAIAANLLTGLITDTLGFRTPSTTPEVLRQAADLLEMGLDMQTLYFNALVRRTLPGARYWGAGLQKLEQFDGIVWTSLSLAERWAAGYPGNDDADLINVVGSIDAARIALMFVEQSPDCTKVSWRGLEPGLDVAAIAVRFGGGGHKAAAGAEIHGSLEQVREHVLRATREALGE